VVNNLLSMTRLETGASTVKTEPCDLLDVVSAALEELGPLAHQRRVSFDISEDVPLVPMDFGLITHVFINVFSNAIKFVPTDQPVEVRGRIIDDQLEVLVVDRGVGVPPEDLGRVFGKFYRVAEAGSSTGLGLGLAIGKAFTGCEPLSSAGKITGVFTRSSTPSQCSSSWLRKTSTPTRSANTSGIPDFELKELEVLVIHANSEVEITEGDLDKARESAGDIDQPDNKTKALVSVMMLRQGCRRSPPDLSGRKRLKAPVVDEGVEEGDGCRRNSTP
jgi:hypothetical protein